MYSICEQLSIYQKLNPLTEIKNKDLSLLIEYFHRMCQQISIGKRQLLILIDGLQDVNIEKSLIAKSNLANNQISWLFFQQLPPGVHLVVSIKRQTTATRVENEILIKKANTQSQPHVMVPLFLHYFNEKMSSETENYLFELPIQIKKADIGDVVTYIKNELNKCDRMLSEDQLQALAQNIENLKQESASIINSQGAANSISSSNSHIETQVAFLYINFMIKEIANMNKINGDIKYLLNADMPKDIETFMKYKIGILIILKEHTLHHLLVI